MCRVRVRFSTSPSSSHNSMSKNSNPIKNMTLIHCLSSTFVCLAHMLLLYMAPSTFPRLLLGLPNTFMFVLFFLQVRPSVYGTLTPP